MTSRRDKIITAASDLFDHFGYGKTSISDIAKKAGISKGAVYLEFSTKSEVLSEVVKTHAQHGHNWMWGVLGKDHDSYLDALRDMLIANTIRVHGLAHSSLTFQEMNQHSEEVRDGLYQINQEREEIIASFLKKAANNKEIPEYSDYTALAQLLQLSLASLTPPYTKHISTHYVEDRNVTMLETEANKLINLAFTAFKAGVNL